MPNSRQATIWTKADLIHWRMYAAVGGDELKRPLINETLFKLIGSEVHKSSIEIQSDTAYFKHSIAASEIGLAKSHPMMSA